MVTDFQKGYSTCLIDVLNIMEPLTKSLPQYIADKDVMAMVRDFNDLFVEIDILNGRNA